MIFNLSDFDVMPYFDCEYDREKYICSHFARDVWFDITGRDIGDLITAPTSALSMHRAIMAQEGDFKTLQSPQEPSLVLMRSKRQTPHVGVYLRSKVLHLREAGVRFEPLAHLTYENISFYQ